MSTGPSLFRRAAACRASGARWSLAWLLGLCLILGASGFAKAALVFTLNDDSCTSNCGSSPWGTVSVTQHLISGSTFNTQQIDFTITLNSPYQFHETSNADSHPMFAIDINESGVSFSGFKLNGSTLPSSITISSAGSSPNVAGYGAFPYTLQDSVSNGNSFTGTLTFSATVSTGTLTPTNIVSNGNAYITADIIDTFNSNTGNVAATGAPINTPEPASVAILAVALGALGVARRGGRTPAAGH